MKAYECGAGAYFATPPVNLIYAYRASLLSITKSTTSLQDRFRLHREASARIKKAAAELGLELVSDISVASNSMTAVSSCSAFHVRELMVWQVYCPNGLTVSDVVPRMAAKGITIAGGLHKDIKGQFLSLFSRFFADVFSV
jgi:alanine-glyoxylate transaminase / serine-glyoxylate transaminase / serine-pyruvate transaminase